MRPSPSRPTTRSTSASGAWAQRAIRTRCSRPVSRGDEAAALIRLPTRRGRAPAADRGSRPSSRASPASAWSSPSATRRAVVLPAPLGPISPYSSPSSTRRSTPASTMVRPKRRYTPLSSTAAVAGLLASTTGCARIEPLQPHMTAPDRAPGPGATPGGAVQPRHDVPARPAGGRPGRPGRRDPRAGLRPGGARADAGDPRPPGQPARPRPAAGVLRALDSRAGALLLTGRPAPLSGCSPAAAEAVVRRSMGARLPLQRRLAAAVGPVALLAAYGWPGPARDATGYPGRSARLPTSLGGWPRCALTATRSWPATWSWSGPGPAAGWSRPSWPGRPGRCRAREGRYAAERDFHHQEGDAYRELYLYAQTLTTDDLGCRSWPGRPLAGARW